MMSIDVSRLQNVQRKGNKITAECPACAAEGHDSQGEHLVVFDNGAYGCVKRLGDKRHLKEIHALAGSKTGKSRGPVPIRIRRPACATAIPKTILVLDWLKKPSAGTQPAPTEISSSRTETEIPPQEPATTNIQAEGGHTGNNAKELSCPAAPLASRH